VDFPAPGEQVRFKLSVSSNVGRPAVTGLAGAIPPGPSCTPREPYSYRGFSGILIVVVTMPSTPGPVTVGFRIAPDAGCPASGRAVTAVSTYRLEVVDPNDE
jgi:hypothetical protein